MRFLVLASMYALLFMPVSLLSQVCRGGVWGEHDTRTGVHKLRGEWQESGSNVKGKGFFLEQRGVLGSIGIPIEDVMIADIHRYKDEDEEIRVSGGRVIFIVGNEVAETSRFSICGVAGFSYDEYTGDIVNGTYREIPIGMSLGYELPISSQISFGQYAMPIIAFISDKRSFDAKNEEEKRKLYLDTGISVGIGSVYLNAEYRLGSHQLGKQDVLLLRLGTNF